MKLTKEGEEKVRQKLLQIGHQIAARAKKKCPVDTGRLRSSIVVEMRNGKVVVGSPVKYAPYVEFGTINMDRQPYLRPAIREVTR